jgi:hypothetical protein
MLASVYCAAPGGRQSFLIRSVDGGATWDHFSTIGNTAEPSVVRLSATGMTAVLRHRGPMLQTWSLDRGKTWSEPVTLEERGVDPDMVVMSHGGLACSYGRPGSNLMFSLDRGRTWVHHRTITDDYISPHQAPPPHGPSCRQYLRTLHLACRDPWGKSLPLRTPPNSFRPADHPPLVDR